MSHEEENLAAQAEQLQAQLDKLATYASTLRRQEGRLAELNYRYNSRIRLSAAEQQERQTMPQHLRETRRAIRAEFPHMPATTSGIEKAMRTYRSALSDVKMSRENQERLSHLGHSRPTTDGWRELVEEAARRLEPEMREVELQNSPQHTPHKRPLRDLYGLDTEYSEQPEQDHTHER